MSEIKKILYSMPYGENSVDFHLPENSHILELPETNKTFSADLFRQRVEKVLSRKDHDLGRVALVVADKTRLCEYSKYLPILLNSLEKWGAKRNSITIYIAYGNHLPQSEDECLSAYGRAYHDYRWVHHNSGEKTLFIQRGATKRGTPIFIRKDIAEASCIITFGALSHHYFAGYGGGRKLLFPGLGEQSAIYQNHSLYLDCARNKLHENCRPSILENNPLAEDLIEAYNACPAHMEIHGIMDENGRVCDLLVGSGYDFFKKAASQHGLNSEIVSSEQFDLVLASCGGHPKDINIIQAHKAIHNAAMWVKDRGQLILLARCPDGVGSATFLPWFDWGSRQKAFEELSAGYSGNGGTALSLMEKTARISISMYTELDHSICKTIDITKMNLDAVQEKVSSARNIAVIRNASLLVRTSPAFSTTD